MYKAWDGAKGAELMRFFPMTKILDVPRGEQLIHTHRPFKNIGIWTLSGACAGHAPPKGPYYFVSTYKFFKM